MEKVILIVDDEFQILKALIRTFLDSEYSIWTAESGEEALDLLSRHKVDLIISDMRMPNMDGYQLLCQVKERYPNTLRMILSGYSDEEIVFKALQRNIAKLYVFKPWENEVLIKLVDQIFETEKLLESSNLLTLINNIEEIPTIKVNYQRILASIDSNADINEISSLIEQDQSMATKLLHIANSAFYGIKTGSVKQAVTYLGLNNVRNLVISTSIIDTFVSCSVPDRLMQDLWSHAYVCNKILSFIYESFLNKKLQETAMTAGLLHNIGMVLFMYNFREKYIQCVKDAHLSNQCITDVEKKVFGTTHHEAGGYLLKWWELPYPIVESALYHHDPFNDNIINKELICAVNIAEYYAWVLLNRTSEYAFKAETFGSLGIDKEVFETKLNQNSISLVNGM